MPTLGLNTAFSVLSNALGVRLDPFPAYNFLVEVEGILAGAFTECSGLSVETEFFEYREGGRNEFMRRFAGPTKYQPLVLKHGITLIDGLWGWHQDVVSGDFSRHNGTIYLLERNSLPVMWWDFTDAFPIKWTGPQLVAQSSAVAFESVELMHNGLSKPGLVSAVAGLVGSLSGSVDIGGGLF